MIATTIILIAILFLVSSISAWTKDDGTKFGAYLWYVILSILVTFAFIGLNKDSYSEGQIDAIKGDYTYEQQFVYRANDTIPVDTIYVKIK